MSIAVPLLQILGLANGSARSRPSAAPGGLS